MYLLDVEKFSKEIGKQQTYIDSLKERIGQESDYAGRMRDEKYEQELKVQKANQRIFELQRANEQMGRLLSLHFHGGQACAGDIATRETGSVQGKGGWNRKGRQ